MSAVGDHRVGKKPRAGKVKVSVHKFKQTHGRSTRM